MKTNNEKIREITKGSGKYYKLNYVEYKDKEKNKIKITAELNIDLNSKAAVTKINKSLKKDKSPLLTELQEIYKENQKLKKEGQITNIYEEIK